jgi:hypothetical protein
MAMTTRDSVGTVYVALITDGRYAGAIKVGFTTNLRRRMQQLRAVVIASEAGSFTQEQHLRRVCGREHRINPRWPEWFTTDVLEVLAPAWERMFGVELPAPMVAA